MKRQLLLFAIAMLVAVSAKARIIEAGENQVWWGYFNESDFEVGDYTIGTGTSMALMGAIYVPANHPQLGTSTVKAVRIYISSGVASTLTGLRLWISKTLPSKVGEADYMQTAIGTLKDGINDFNLRTPYEVNNGGFYIGYYVKSSTGYFIRSGGTDAPNAFLVGNPEVGMNWTDLNGNGLGKLAFQLLIEGGTFNEYGAVADDFGNSFVLKGESVDVPVSITNTGKQTISQISYTIATDDGPAGPEQTLSLGSLPFGGTKTVSLAFPSEKEPRKYKKTLTITKVNEEENPNAGSKAEGFIITLAEKRPVRPVIEEFTGTWCGWCPRGMVGMEKIHETFGDQVVQIAAHSGDVMQLSEYTPVINTFADGYPSSITDRLYSADPSFASLRSVVNTALGRLAQGTVQLSAEWEDDNCEAVAFTATTNFSYSDDEGQYGIAFVLTEDGLSGTTSDWAQANYYNGQSGDSSMSFWYTAGASVSGLEFNHVPVAAWGIQKGIDGSVKEKITAGANQTFTYVGDITKKSLIQDKSKLKAVALLIDRTSGVIVNAAQAEIKTKGTGISLTKQDADVQTMRYSVDGRRLSGAAKGINIIRTADGSVRKVLVK